MIVFQPLGNSHGVAVSKDDDLKEVQLQDRQRGAKRRPVDVEARKIRKRFMQSFREALELGNEEIFIEAIIRELGQLPGSPEYRQSLNAWRAYHGKHGK